jgi:deltex-like protein
MHIQVVHEICPGFESSTKSLRIDYSIPEGKQASYHDNPGKWYNTTTRTAFLPNNPDGRQLLSRLKYAWMHGMTFTIGTSLTTGQSDSVVWTSIHHKTTLHGGSHGFPDPSYISRCNQDLTALGVPSGNTNPVIRNETLWYMAPATLSQTSSIADALVTIVATSVDEFQATAPACAAPSAPLWTLDDSTCDLSSLYAKLSNNYLQGCSDSFKKIYTQGS